MNALRIVGALLIVAGILALVFRGFSYTQETQGAKIGPIELTVHERKTVDIPVWAGVAVIAIGGALLYAGSRKR